MTLAEQGPGEYFGEMVLDEGPRSASVITLEPCRFLVVPKSDVLEFLANNRKGNRTLVTIDLSTATHFRRNSARARSSTSLSSLSLSREVCLVFRRPSMSRVRTGTPSRSIVIMCGFRDS